MALGAALLLSGVLLSGCDALGARPTGETAVPYPAGCSVYELSPRRCKALLDWVLQQAHAQDRAIASVDLLGDPGCGETSNPNIVCRRSASFVARMRVHLAEGGVIEQSKFCSIEANYSFLCTEHPEIRVGGSTFGGYWDTTGATPPPLDPAAVAAAKPLRVDALDIPIDHVGHYEVSVGRAIIPMGILTRGIFTLANPRPTDLATTEDGVILRILSTTPGAKPFLNLYDHGWHDGTEEVAVDLVFDILEFQRGATLQIRGLVVE
jgi:hypothetical protein